MFILLIVSNLEHCDPDCDICLVGCSEDREKLEKLFINHTLDRCDGEDMPDKVRDVAKELMKSGDYRGPENSLGYSGWWVAKIEEI